MMFCHLVMQMAEIPAGCFSASNSSTEGAHFQVHWGWNAPRTHERTPHGIELLANPTQRLWSV